MSPPAHSHIKINPNFRVDLLAGIAKPSFVDLAELGCNGDCEPVLKSQCWEAARRKPRLLLRLSGLLLSRLPAVQFLELLFQLPPRFTRLELPA